MKKLAAVLIGVLVLSACDTVPESLIKDAYEAKEEKDLDRWADLMCNQMSDEDKQAFQNEFAGEDIKIKDLKITQDKNYDDVHVPVYEVTYRVETESGRSERTDRVGLKQRTANVYCIAGITTIDGE